MFLPDQGLGIPGRHPQDLLYRPRIFAPVNIASIGPQSLAPICVSSAPVTPDQPILALEFVADDGRMQRLDTTAEHLFHVVDKGWVAARDLVSGDEVYTSRGGWLRVSRGTWTGHIATVYNLEVDGFHTYFVGREGLWVYNACAARGGGNRSQWISPQQKADLDHGAMRDRLRKEQFGFESGRHDQYHAAMRDELRRLADEADTAGKLSQYGARLRNIAETYAKRAKEAHPGSRR